MTETKVLSITLKSWFHCHTYLILMKVLLDLDRSIAQLNNTIIGEPFVSCAADAIYAKWKTSETFSGGHVNVRYAPNRYCFQVLVTNNQIELLVPHLDCRLSRLRTVDPPGLLIETTVLISFHDLFFTAGDKLFVLKCLHTRQGNLSVKGVPHKGNLASHTSLIILPTNNSSEISQKVAPKKRLECSYTVKQRVPKGKSTQPVKPTQGEWASRQRRHLEEEEQEDKWVSIKERVAIGTPLLHQWSCINAEPSQCLMVSSCIMKTQEDEHRLVDENGCSMLPSLLPQLQYLDNHTVSQIIPLFSTVDQPFLYFQCQLTLINSVARRGERPPICSAPKCSTSDSHSSEMIFEVNHRRKRRQIKGMASTNFLNQTLDVISQRVDILPFGDQPPSSTVDPSCDRQKQSEYLGGEDPEEAGQICMPKRFIGIVGGIFLGVIIVFALACVLRSFLPRLKFSHVPTEQSQSF